MNVRRHLGLIIAGGVSLALVIILAVLLVRFHGEYQRVRSGLRIAESKLQRLHERDPYPSEANVAVIQSNLMALQEFYNQLRGTLRLGQIDPINMEPADFPPLLDRTIKRLYDRAREGGVKVPPRFAFGFERYALGSLPNKEDVSRLTVQLRTVEKICELVFKNKVNEIAAVERTVFEKGVIEQTGGGVRRRGYMEEETATTSTAEEWRDPNKLFARETYTINVIAPDAVVINVLNDLAKIGMIAVVSSVQLLGEIPQTKPSETQTATATLVPARTGVEATTAGRDLLDATATGTLPQTKEPPPHEERIVAGRAMVKASLQIHVYRLLNEAKGQENPS